MYAIAPIRAHAHNPEKHETIIESDHDRRLYKLDGSFKGASAAGTLKKDACASDAPLSANISDV